MTNNKQQTAVEWLVDEFKALGIYSSTLKEKCEQAKAMEKEQIIDSFDEGKRDGYKTAREWDEMILWSSAEQYYEQTYGGNK
jgi:hypothetical protein